MKVAIIADPIDNQKGGIHVYTRELVKALATHSQHHEYLLLRERIDPDLEGIEQIAVPNFRWGLGIAALRQFFAVPWILARKGVDAVLEPAHFGPFNLPKRIHRITMMHDLTPILFPQYHNWHSQQLQKIFLPGILRRAKLVLSNSQNTTRDLHQHYPQTKNKTATILLGVDHIQRERTRQRTFLNQKEIQSPYWLSVGTIEPRKNLVRLLEAYRLFRDKHNEKTLLLIVGQKGWKSESFFEALEQHPYREDIILPGFVPDEALTELYSHALALIYPSEYEGFGFPVLEAYGCGCPVVCADNSSLPEVGGKWAFYHDAYDAHSIYQAMQSLSNLSDTQRHQLQLEVIKWADSFTWKKYVEEFEQVLSQNLIAASH
ncbi:MAG: glycosyltransferase family 4 protein [Chitinophagales bacterium]|nr:glycosyltransferase family 4 protein [Chitinophagales bacterium]